MSTDMCIINFYLLAYLGAKLPVGSKSKVPGKGEGPATPGDSLKTLPCLTSPNCFST